MPIVYVTPELIPLPDAVMLANALPMMLEPTEAVVVLEMVMMYGCDVGAPPIPPVWFM